MFGAVQTHMKRYAPTAGGLIPDTWGRDTRGLCSAVTFTTPRSFASSSSARFGFCPGLLIDQVCLTLTLAPQSSGPLKKTGPLGTLEPHGEIWKAAAKILQLPEPGEGPAPLVPIDTQHRHLIMVRFNLRQLRLVAAVVHGGLVTSVPLVPCPDFSLRVYLIYFP